MSTRLLQIENACKIYCNIKHTHTHTYTKLSLIQTLLKQIKSLLSNIKLNNQIKLNKYLSVSLRTFTIQITMGIL